MEVWLRRQEAGGGARMQELVCSNHKISQLRENKCPRMLLGFNTNNKVMQNDKKLQKMAKMQNFDPHFCVIFHVRKY